MPARLSRSPSQLGMLPDNIFTGFTGTASARRQHRHDLTQPSPGTFTGGTWTGTVTLDQAPAMSPSRPAPADQRNLEQLRGAAASDPRITLSIQTIASPQIVNAPFQITITALDSANNPLPVYTGMPALTASLGTVTPLSPATLAEVPGWGRFR